MTDTITTADMSDEQYRAHQIEVLARDCADGAWRAGLADLIEREGIEYSELVLTPLDVEWIEGEEECKGLTHEEIQRAQETFRDRVAELHAGNGDYAL